MIKNAVHLLGAAIIAALVGAFVGLCALLIVGGGAAVLLQGEGMPWPHWADPIVFGIAILAMLAAGFVTFREMREKFTQ